MVAHLDADGNPVLTPFVNDVSAIEAGQARLVVRHTAAAPPVDVRADGEVLFPGWLIRRGVRRRPGGERPSADVTLAGENKAVSVRRPGARGGHCHDRVRVGLGGGRNLDLAVQTIDGLHSAPSGVPGGETGAAAAR